MPTLGTPFDIEIYRSFKYNYANGIQGDTSKLCGCHCDASKCVGVDKLFLYGQETAALETYYDKWVKGQMGFTEDKKNALEQSNTSNPLNVDFSKFIKDYFVNIDHTTKTYNDDNVENASKYYKSTYSSECQICTQIQNILINRKSEILGRLNGLNTAYNIKRDACTKELENQISNITTYQSTFSDNTKQIQQLQKKIKLAHDLLNAQASKLKTVGESLNSLQVQYKERGKNRVAIGLPYLQPFLTMSSRNFLIMMICLKLILITVICVYGFYGSVKYTANVNHLDQASAQENNSSLNTNLL